MEQNIDKLIKLASLPAEKPVDLDSRIMVAVARRMIEDSLRRKRRALYVTVTAVGVLAIVCVILVVLLWPKEQVETHSYLVWITTTIEQMKAANITNAMYFAFTGVMLLLGVGTYEWLSD